MPTDDTDMDRYLRSLRRVDFAADAAMRAEVRKLLDAGDTEGARRFILDYLAKQFDDQDRAPDRKDSDD